MAVVSTSGGSTIGIREVPGHLWATDPGTDFSLMSLNNGYLTAGNAHELADYGWTTTALSYSSATGSDFLDSSDMNSIQTIAFDAAADLLLSPLMFGDYRAGTMAANILGYRPTTLTLECAALFSVASANENISGFGFSTGTSLTNTNHLAFIFSDGTNFQCRSSAASDAGALVDNLFHDWKIVLTAGGSVEWFMDGISQGTFALKTDTYPTAFSASVTTTNRMAIGTTRITYR